MNAVLALGPSAASDADQSSSAPKNLADLLLSIDRKQGTNEGMLHAVAARFLEYLGRVAEDVPIELLDTHKTRFVAHLKGAKYKPSSVKSYRNYLNSLIGVAQRAGWKRSKAVIPPEWEGIAGALPRRLVTHIVGYAVQIGKSPANFSEEDLKMWQRERVKEGRSLTTSEDICTRFRTCIARAGLSACLPLIDKRRDYYGVPLRQMHPRLRQEIEEILEWKVSDLQLDRPSGARVRPITAEHMGDVFCVLTGYVQNIEHEAEVERISDLVTRSHIARFTTWAKNNCKLKGQSLVYRLGLLHAALRHNPRYESLDLTWLPSIISQITVESQSAIDKRKAKKFIPYSEAEQIPVRIRAQRSKITPGTPYDLAISVRNELLMTWLIVLAWRQRNIRECKIVGIEPNLFKAPISPFCQSTQPAWVAKEESTSPGKSYWQFHFDVEETKTKHEVHGFLPSELIPPLENYLSNHRPILLGGHDDPGTLFFCENGTPFEINQFTSTVRNIAAKHTGVAVTPHLYRDIVAFEWLQTHPEDHLTLSKILWHRNTNTTLQIYGRRFDESTGTARMDEWRSQRSKNAT
jgi:integrase